MKLTTLTEELAEGRCGTNEIAPGFQATVRGAAGTDSDPKRKGASGETVGPPSVPGASGSEVANTNSGHSVWLR